MAVTFNNVDLSQYMDIGRISRDLLPPRTVRTLEIPYKAGAYFLNVKNEVRSYEVPYRIKGDSYTDLQARINEIAEILDTDSPKDLIFHREPDKSFQAICVNETEYDPINPAVAKGTLTFLIPDPEKLGSGYNVTFDTVANGWMTLNNTANSSYYPIWTIDIGADMTYISLISADGFVMIGQPEAVDSITKKPEELVVWDEMDDLSKWTTSGVVADYGDIAGAFTVDGGHQFKVPDWGSDETYPSSWHGPAVRKTLPSTLQDFRVELEVQLVSGRPNTGRIELLLLDNTGGTLGRMVLWDRYTGELNTAHIMAGTLSDQREIIRSAGVPLEGDWNDFLGKLIIRREGNTWKAVVVKTDASGNYNYKHYLYNRITLPPGIYDKPLGALQLHVTKYGAGDSAAVAVRDLKVHRINQVTEEEVPSLFKAGDRLVIDHEKGAVFLNGRYFMQHVDIGSTFFKIHPGTNDINIHSNDDSWLDVSVAYRERWK